MRKRVKSTEKERNVWKLQITQQGPAKATPQGPGYLCKKGAPGYNQGHGGRGRREFTKSTPRIAERIKVIGSGGYISKVSKQGGKKNEGRGKTSLLKRINLFFKWRIEKEG